MSPSCSIYSSQTSSQQGAFTKPTGTSISAKQKPQLNFHCHRMFSPDSCFFQKYKFNEYMNQMQINSDLNPPSSNGLSLHTITHELCEQPSFNHFVHTDHKTTCLFDTTCLHSASVSIETTQLLTGFIIIANVVIVVVIVGVAVGCCLLNSGSVGGGIAVGEGA